MPQINPKTGKPYPDTPAGKAASEAEYKRIKAAAQKIARANASKSGVGKKRLSALKKKAMAKSPYKKKGK